MAKKKKVHNALELAMVVDAVVDGQIALPPDKRDEKALLNAIASLNMETPEEAVKQTRKKATPKKEA